MFRKVLIGVSVIALTGAGLASCTSGPDAGAAQSAATADVSLTGQRVDNFQLVDQFGVGHELYYHKASSAVVLVTHALNDPTSDQAAAALAALQASHAGKGVEFMMLNSSNGYDHTAIEKKTADLSVPVLDDRLQLVGRSLGVTRTGEAMVIDPKTWKIAYHGAVDGVGTALTQLTAGQPVTVAAGKLSGAPIAFPDRARKAEFAKISYTKDVAPILAENCVVCHSEGGMAPFAMNEYQTIKGFAPMIREVLRTKRMPPFHADPHYGKWENDMNLSDQEILTLVNWVEAGAPRGEGEDPLELAHYVAPEWPMGKPDLIVKIPASDIPASGIVDYKDWAVPSELTEGKWLKATAWKAGARETVHHILGGWIPQQTSSSGTFSWNVSIGGYGPGGPDNLTPANTGIYVPPGGSFTFQMHYTTTGKAARDETEVGLYFYDEKPEFVLRQAAVTDFSIEIPAGAARHEEQAYLEIPHDMVLYGTQPHAHYRGYASKLTLRYPDGTEKVLLNQPQYDFSWQREYIFDGMLDVPAGSKIIANYIFDNSVNNRYNPDPSINVTFGEQTHEEMLFTFIRYRWKDETSTNPTDQYQTDLQSGVLFGALDDNIDDKLQLAEFRTSPRLKIFRDNFKLMDQNSDGAIDKAEFKRANDFMRQMRNRGGQAPAASSDAGATAFEQQATGGGN
ncbi:redoxin domain-containing protein [bacterium]|nr:redoxin domain-containing protein [bacterium]